jgi:TetR/AcrR family transcriptional repressor of nem operon
MMNVMLDVKTLQGRGVRYPADVTAARHERILEGATRLIRERGLNGVSVPEIMKAAKLTHGPFYNHFSSREALVTEVIDRALGALASEISAVKSSKVARRQFLDSYLSLEHRDNPADGCAIAALATDVGRNPPAKAPFTRRLKQVLTAVAAKFSTGGKDGSRAEAIRLLAQIVGALILARAVDDSELSEEILEKTRAAL